jgi:hypothetical protein
MSLQLSRGVKMFVSNFITFGVPIGFIVALMTPIRKNLKVLRNIKLLFIVALIYSIYLDFTPTSSGNSSSSSMGLNFFYFKILMILFLIFFKSSKMDRSVNGLNIQGNPTGSRGNFIAWCVLLGIIFCGGFGAWLIDVNNPSEMDIYTSTNDSALITIACTGLALSVFGLGARFSYLKYARVNQAALIANAIKSQIPSSNSSTPSRSEELNSQRTENRLRKLASLLADGLITQEEYEQKKKEIIDSI